MYNFAGSVWGDEDGVIRWAKEKGMDCLGRFYDPVLVLPWLIGMAAISFPLFYYLGGWTLWWQFLFWVLLLFPALEDWRTGYISDGWSLALGIGAVLYHGGMGTLDSAWGGLLAGVLLWMVFRLYPQAIGEGDLWLGAAIGTWLSGWEALVCLWLAFVLGSAAGVCHILRGGSLKDEMAFGPFLCLSGIVTHLLGKDMIAWYGSFF